MSRNAISDKSQFLEQSESSKKPYFKSCIMCLRITEKEEAMFYFSIGKID